MLYATPLSHPPPPMGTDVMRSGKLSTTRLPTQALDAFRQHTPEIRCPNCRRRGPKPAPKRRTNLGSPIRAQVVPSQIHDSLTYGGKTAAEWAPTYLAARWAYLAAYWGGLPSLSGHFFSSGGGWCMSTLRCTPRSTSCSARPTCRDARKTDLAQEAAARRGAMQLTSGGVARSDALVTYGLHRPIACTSSIGLPWPLGPLPCLEPVVECRAALRLRLGR